MLGPRPDRMPWSDHFMLIALLVAERSPDPNTTVGSILVNKRNRIIATGYNGAPPGIHANQIPWDRDATDPLESKYTYVKHSEDNCLDNVTQSPEGATLYVTLHPCENCAKRIIGARLKEVIYLNNPYSDTWQVKAANKMFDLAHIKISHHQWQKAPKEYLEKLISKL